MVRAFRVYGCAIGLGENVPGRCLGQADRSGERPFSGALQRQRLFGAGGLSSIGFSRNTPPIPSSIARYRAETFASSLPTLTARLLNTAAYLATDGTSTASGQWSLPGETERVYQPGKCSGRYVGGYPWTLLPGPRPEG